MAGNVTSLLSSNDEEVIARAILLRALGREMGTNGLLTALSLYLINPV